MEAREGCEKITDKEEIENTPNGASDQCAEDGDSFGALNNAEVAGFVSDKCTVGSAMVSEEMSMRRLNMNSAPDSKEFEFDISGLNGQALAELGSISSPADELFYKGQLLPLHAPLRIQMIEKLDKLSSEIRPSQQKVLETYVGTQTENTENSKNISSNCSGIDKDCEELRFHSPCKSSIVTHKNFTSSRSGVDRDCEELGFHTPCKSFDVTPCNNISSNCSGTDRDCEQLGFHTPCEPSDVTPYKVRKESNETCSDSSPPALDRSQAEKLLDSTHSQQTALAHKLKASKAFVKSLFSKACNTRGASDHHSQNSISIKKESHDPEDAATISRIIPREKSHATHRKSFSGSFSLFKGSLLIPKPHSKPFHYPSRECPTHGGAILKRNMNSVNSNMENEVQGAIDHCNQSHSADPKNMIDTSSYLQRSTSNPEGHAGGHAHNRSRSDSSIAACEYPEKPGLG